MPRIREPGAPRTPKKIVDAALAKPSKQKRTKSIELEAKPANGTGAESDHDTTTKPNGTDSDAHNNNVIEEGFALLNEVEAFLGRFIAYPSEHARVAHVLWIGHTHLMAVWDSTPRLAALSPEPGSGKSRLLEVSELLSPDPVTAVNMSAAYLFRRVGGGESLPTILYDEIDTVFGDKAKDNEDIRGLLNAGHRRGTVAGRCVLRNGNVETEEIPAFCAVALAGLGWLPDTILTRAVVIRMRKRKDGEKIEPFRHRMEEPRGHKLRDRLAAWARHVEPSLRGNYPELPPEIQDRDADKWEPLVAVANAAGGNWPERAKAAAKALVKASNDETPSLGVKLLTDIKTVFGTAEKMATSDLLAQLNALPESPWGDIKGRALDDRSLALRLRPYEVKPKLVRINDQPKRGYTRADFMDAWERYVPAPLGESVTAVTGVTEAAPNGHAGGFVTDVTLVTPICSRTGVEDEESITSSNAHASEQDDVTGVTGDTPSDAPKGDGWEGEV